MSERETPRIVWTDPLVRLAVELRKDAESARRIPSARDAAELYEDCAGRVEQAIEDGRRGDWMPSHEAARLREITTEGVRAWCRRRLRPMGLAEKRGGEWWVHVNAFSQGRAA